jgi:hypothetical protein
MAFYRTVVQVEILSTKPIPKTITLDDAVAEMNEGFAERTSLTGVSMPVSNQRLNEKAFRIRAKKQGDWKADDIQEFLHPEGE